MKQRNQKNSQNEDDPRHSSSHEMNEMKEIKTYSNAVKSDGTVENDLDEKVGETVMYTSFDSTHSSSFLMDETEQQALLQKQQRSSNKSRFQRFSNWVKFHKV